jgi:hypothetical protein
LSDGKRRDCLIHDDSDQYQSYFLRIWASRCQGRAHWRASVESPATGEYQTFATLDELFLYLKARLRLPSDSDSGITPQALDEGAEGDRPPPAALDANPDAERRSLPPPDLGPNEPLLSVNPQSLLNGEKPHE